jgi:hypothetical protein
MYDASYTIEIDFEMPENCPMFTRFVTGPPPFCSVMRRWNRNTLKPIGL